MKRSDYTTRFLVSQTPEQVFAAVADVRAWWSADIEGPTDAPGAEFVFRHRGMHRSRQRITEWIPGRKVAWRVLESRLEFVRDRAEWDETEIVFEITPRPEGTELRFTHRGLVPDLECFGDCSGAWGHYVGTSLRELITTGKGRPAPAPAEQRGEAVTPPAATGRRPARSGR